MEHLKHLTDVLSSWGFMINPYDQCVGNKMINGYANQQNDLENNVMENNSENQIDFIKMIQAWIYSTLSAQDETRQGLTFRVKKLIGRTLWSNWCRIYI